MRILFLYDALYPDRTGGVEHRNRELARGLAHRGHEVTLAGWAASLPEPPSGVDILELPYATELYDAHGKRRPWAAIEFARAVMGLDVERWDVIETANIPYLHLWPLWLKSRSTQTKLIVTWHELMGPSWEDYGTRWTAPFFSAIERSALRIGDHRVAVSEFTRDRLRHGAGLSEVDVPVIPNGVPTSRLRAIRREVETSWGTGPALVFAGRLHANKRIQFVLESLDGCNFDRPTPWFRIIGAGPSERALRKRTRHLGLSDAVEFTGRVESVEDVWRLVAESDVAVQPSSREGFGMFPLEAMALGLPVLYWPGEGSAVGEVVQPGTGGMPVEPDEGQDFRTCFEKIRSDYSGFSERAMQRGQDFDWARATRLFEKLVV